VARSLIRVGLTGGIATGKSTCLRHFAALGIPTIDSDVIARELVEPGTPGLAAVVSQFGSGVLRADGSLDRAQLGRIVFTDDSARRDLEAIIHPGVFARLQEWFAGQRGVAVADVPLLFETNSQDAFDLIIVAACRPDQQVTRLMLRDGLTETEARQRIAAQGPVDEKRARADYVIDTSGAKAEAETQVKDVLEKIVGQEQRPNSQGEE